MTSSVPERMARAMPLAVMIIVVITSSGWPARRAASGPKMRASENRNSRRIPPMGLSSCVAVCVDDIDLGSLVVFDDEDLGALDQLGAGGAALDVVHVAFRILDLRVAR